MSLQVWLPLNGNLNNNGIKEITINPGSAISNNDGKIGKCYYFDTANMTTIPNCREIIDSGHFSIGCWFKTAGLAEGKTQAGLIALTYGCSLFLNGSGYLCFRTDNGSNLNTIHYDKNLFDNKWHCAYGTYDGTKVRLYLDGRLVSSENRVISNRYSNTGALGAELNNDPYYRLLGYMNDVRIYDECLTTKQVHEISKGLVAHYSLSDPYIEGCTNLKPIPKTYTTNTNPSWDKSLNGAYLYTPNEANNVWSGGYNGGVSEPATGYHARWEFDEEGQLIMHFPNLNSVINQKGRWLGFGQEVIGLKGAAVPAGSKYTISWSQKTDNLNLAPRGGIYYKTTSSASNSFYDGCPSFGKNTRINTWERFSYTFTRVAAFDNNTNSQNLYVYGDNSTYEGNIWVKDIQIIIKDHDVPLENTSIPRPNKEYEEDLSGNGNNAIISGSILCQKDAARYETSYNFPTGLEYIKTPISMTMSELSISFWVKPHSGNGAYSTISSNFNDPIGGLWLATNCEGCKVWAYRGAYMGVSGYLENNKWHHCVYTFKDGLSRWYINGQEQFLTKNTYTGTTLPVSNLTIGNSYTGTSWNTRRFGNISDYRLYATALSDQDIKDLYDSPIYIDKNGDLRCYEVKEEAINIMNKANDDLWKKTETYELANHNQTNCQISLTNDGFRVYRPANLVYSSVGNTMWGGLRLRVSEKNLHFLIQGHTYIVLWDAKGQTSNAQATSGWCSNMGWSGPGVNPVPTNESSKLIPANFNSSEYETFWYKCTFDTIYKVCNGTSNPNFTQGNTYLSYKDFQVGWAYSDTGPLGTDIYMRNFRMYDITDNPQLEEFLKNGITTAGSFEEGKSALELNKSQEIFLKEIVEI